LNINDAAACHRTRNNQNDRAGRGDTLNGGLYAFTILVKSDHCSTRKARMSRTEAGNHGSALSAMIAPNKLARSSELVV
jgi:hypothetical protein